MCVYVYVYVHTQLRGLISKRFWLRELGRERVTRALPEPLFMLVRTPGYKCQSSTLTGSSKQGNVLAHLITEKSGGRSGTAFLDCAAGNSLSSVSFQTRTRMKSGVACCKSSCCY